MSASRKKSKPPASSQLVIDPVGVEKLLDVKMAKAKLR
jgi:hypothetical protein